MEIVFKRLDVEFHLDFSCQLLLSIQSSEFVAGDNPILVPMSVSVIFFPFTFQFWFIQYSKLPNTGNTHKQDI